MGFAGSNCGEHTILRVCRMGLTRCHFLFPSLPYGREGLSLRQNRGWKIQAANTKATNSLTFPLTYYQEASETPDPDYDHLFQVIDEEVAGFQATDAGEKFWGLRVIWSTARSQDPRSIIEDADNCVATKLIWPQLVAGYDLAGAESLGRPLADLLPELFWFRKQCALEGVQVPFFLRAASESLGTTDPATTTTTTADGNLLDALLLGTRRIGCTLSLHQHPRLVEAVKDKRILVEISLPSSSDGAIGPISTPGSSSSNTMHHNSLSALLAQGVPCALCDDGTPSGRAEPDGASSRVTGTFWRALHASWGNCSTTVDLATLGSLAENSVRWAAFEDQDAESWYVSCRVAFPLDPIHFLSLVCCSMRHLWAASRLFCLAP
jgi:adenosine deaminase CECR1